MEFRQDEAAWYLAALIVFYGSVATLTAARGQLHVQLHGTAGFLLLIPMSGCAVNVVLAYRQACRARHPLTTDFEFFLQWMLRATWLWCCLAVAEAVRALRR
jgi:hypothetical protein